jgi:ELWxxDGT repeat protein
MQTSTLRVICYLAVVLLSFTSLPLLAIDQRASSSYPDFELTVGGRTFFTARNDFSTGFVLWVTDTTPAGTFALTDPHQLSILYPYVVRLGSDALFRDASGTLWLSNGTVAGTRMIDASIRPLGIDPPMVGGDSIAWFRARTSAEGTELWVTDGLPLGTHMLADLFPGPVSSNPVAIGAIGDALFFYAFTPLGRAVFVSDGTIAGTVKLASVTPDAVGILPTVNSKLLFLAGPSDASDLWSTDGTAAGTKMIHHFATPFVFGFARVAQEVYFQVADEVDALQLWRTDGTAAGTTMVANLPAAQRSDGVGRTYALGNLVVFEARVNGSWGLWSYDPASGAVHLIKDGFVKIDIASADAQSQSLFFITEDVITALWRTDGTTAGTTLVRTFGPPVLLFLDTRWSMMAAGTGVVFGIDDGVSGVEPWFSDGTERGTYRLANIKTDPPSLKPRSVRH